MEKFEYEYDRNWICSEVGEMRKLNVSSCESRIVYLYALWNGNQSFVTPTELPEDNYANLAKGYIAVHFHLTWPCFSQVQIFYFVLKERSTCVFRMWFLMNYEIEITGISDRNSILEKFRNNVTSFPYFRRKFFSHFHVKAAASDPEIDTADRKIRQRLQ